MPGTIPGLEVRDEQHRFPALLIVCLARALSFSYRLRPVSCTFQKSLSGMHLTSKEGLKTFYAKGENEAVSFIFY